MAPIGVGTAGLGKILLADKLDAQLAASCNRLDRSTERIAPMPIDVVPCLLRPHAAVAKLIIDMSQLHVSFAIPSTEQTFLIKFIFDMTF